ncbi:MAG: DUF4132 domain-containing protein, partial [Oscillochloris sp.]|nr:DUF4132 domain-containing protein [Oscillochloris sp.]
MDTSAPLSITPTNTIPAVQQILDRDTELRNLPRGLERERERRSTTLREQIKQDIAQLASDSHKQLLRLLLSGIPFAEPIAAMNVSLERCHWSVSELDSLLIYSYRLQLCAEAYHTALRTCSENPGYAALVQRFLLELYARAYHSNLALTRAGLVLMCEYPHAAQAFFAEQNETNLWHKIWVATDKQLDQTLKLLIVLTNRPNPTHSDEPPVAWWEQWREAIACLEPSAGRALCQQIWMYRLSEYDFCDEPNERYWAWHYYATYGNAALWGITSIADETTCAILGTAVPGLLRNNPTAGTIALKALGRINTVHAHEQLQRLATQLKNKTALKTIATIRRKVAQQQGIDQDTLDDRVDARGIDTSGRRFWTLADGYTAALWLNPAGRIEVLYRDPDGRERSSCPKVVKAAATNTLAELRETTKYLRNTYAILRTRLELALIHQREWDRAVWQETVAQNPLFKHLADRLIWQITTGDRVLQARPSEEGWVGTDDTVITPPALAGGV